MSKSLFKDVLDTEIDKLTKKDNTYNFGVRHIKNRRIKFKPIKNTFDINRG